MKTLLDLLFPSQIDRLPLSRDANKRWVIVALVIVFGLFTALGGVALLRSKYSDDPVTWLFFVLMTIIEGILIYEALFRTTRPHTPLIYAASRVWRKRLYILYFIIFLVFIITVMVLFGLFYGEEASVRQRVGGVFVVSVFIVVCAYIYRDVKRKLKGAASFGTSRLEILDSTPLRLGQTADAILHVDHLPVSSPIVTITLFNLHEYWVYPENRSSKERRPRRKLEIISQHQQSLLLHANEGRFTFRVPITGRPTDYQLTTPTFWELEVRHEPSGYYARFFPEVI